MTTSSKKGYQNVTISPKENSEIEIIFEITTEKIAEVRSDALTHIGETASIDGFRKGNIPHDVLEKNVGEMKILQEATELALADVYPLILAEHTIQPLGQPNVSITKMAPKEVVELKINTAVMPTVTVADYKKIAKNHTVKEVEDFTATEKEIEETITTVRQNIAAQQASQKKDDDTKAPIYDADGKEISSSKNTEKSLPELTDEFVKTIGSFENVLDFKKKIKEGIEKEKEMKAIDARRTAILEDLIKDSTVSVPTILVDSELAKMLAQFKDDIERTGMKYEDYLIQLQKTDEDLKTEWRENAEKRAKTQLIINKIAVAEDIRADKSILDNQTKQMLEMYKDANEEQVRVYIETILINEKVLKFLDEQSGAKKESEKNKIENQENKKEDKKKKKK